MLIAGGWWVEQANRRERLVVSMPIGTPRVEVLRLVGEPDRVTASGTWCYENPWGGWSTGLIFEADRVSAIDWAP